MQRPSARSGISSRSGSRGSSRHFDAAPEPLEGMDRRRRRPRGLCRGNGADPCSAARVADGPVVGPGGASGGVRDRGGRHRPELLAGPAAQGNRAALWHAWSLADRDHRRGVCGRARPATTTVIGSAGSADRRLRALGARAPTVAGAGASRLPGSVEADAGALSGIYGTTPRPSGVTEIPGSAASLSYGRVTALIHLYD